MALIACPPLGRVYAGLQVQRTKPRASTDTCCPPSHPQEFWRRPDGQPATREHLLMALADLDELLIRATFSSVPRAASISAVSLEVAQPGPSGGPRALEVEECRCPPGYVGLSCQVSVSPAWLLLRQCHSMRKVIWSVNIGGDCSQSQVTPALPLLQSLPQ